MTGVGGFSLLLLMVLVTVTLLLKLDAGDDLETHHRHTLEGLGRRSVRQT